MVKIKKNKGIWKNKLMLGIPTKGIVRYEWVIGRYSQVIPVNWSLSEFVAKYIDVDSLFPVTWSPIGYLVHDAYNLIVKSAVEGGFEWLLTIEDDVIVPQDLFVRIRKYVDGGQYPVVSGLYFTKSNPSEPQIYRGRGNGPFRKWKMGELVWCDGVAMGCLLVHMSLLRLMWEESPEYTLPDGTKTRKVFDTPAEKWFDQETGQYKALVGTQDLYWCDRVIREKVLERAGWKRIGKKKYPFLVDTTIFCRHIDLNTGLVYPFNF
uniref:Glycosyltransferase family 2 protein n=1 Tax=candidate division CPR3 bacterium TaxID=2268181 RepID=A0A7V3JAA2_UNCC3